MSNALTIQFQTTTNDLNLPVWVGAVRNGTFIDLFMGTDGRWFFPTGREVGEDLLAVLRDALAKKAATELRARRVAAIASKMYRTDP